MTSIIELETPEDLYAIAALLRDTGITETLKSLDRRFRVRDGAVRKVSAAS